jgi:hypothetical protein
VDRSFLKVRGLARTGFGYLKPGHGILARSLEADGIKFLCGAPAFLTPLTSFLVEQIFKKGVEMVP